MLPRAERLSAAEFAEVFENGRVLRHPLMQLRVMWREVGDETTGTPSVRAAFVAPKKLGKAVRRNRLRRRVRERYRLLRAGSTLSALAECDLIWVIAGAAETASAVELDDALCELSRRAATLVGKNR
jgi:ribonuclease P protein component